MYVCICHAVTDRQIRAAADNGARSLKDLRRELGVTRDCGRCASCAHDCLKAAQARPSARQPAEAAFAEAAFEPAFMPLAA